MGVFVREQYYLSWRVGLNIFFQLVAHNLPLKFVFLSKKPWQLNVPVQYKNEDGYFTAFFQASENELDTMGMEVLYSKYTFFIKVADCTIEQVADTTLKQENITRRLSGCAAARDAASGAP